MIEHGLWIVASLVLLFFGAEWLVRGSAELAARLGLTPLVIGLTVVAYGTSMPELIVSTRAAVAGQGDIALGNAIGSNIFNICVILGLSAVVHPMRVKLQLLRLDAPILAGVSLLLLFFLGDMRISRAEAALLCGGIIVYSVMNILLARRETSAEVKLEFAEAMPKKIGSLWRDLAFVGGGLLVLVLGSRWLVEHSVGLAKMLGVSEAIIGLTVVAAGTSMPELATSIVAAWRKQPDIAIGNVVGSNIYNILCILGVSGLIAPLHGPGLQQLDLYLMLGTAAVLLPILWTGFVVRRWEGLVLLATYGGYLWMRWPKGS
jgi:cation:H+ antiporter